MPAAAQELKTHRASSLRGSGRFNVLIWAMLCATGATVSWVQPAQGLGVLIADTSDASIKASRTIIAKTAESRTFQMTEIHFDSEIGMNFVWVLPIPAEGEEVVVTKCGETHFEDIAKLAQPRILLRQREDGKGCGEAAIPTPIESVIGTHQFSQHPIAPEAWSHSPFEDIDALQEWVVTVGGYPIQDSNHGVLAHYVANTYHFAAVKVVPTHTTGRICLALEYDPPTQREYDHLVPMKTGSVSSGETDPVSTEILIYALDEGTVRPLTKQDGGSVYRAVTLNLHEVTATDENSSDYDAVFEEAVGDPPGFIIEYSGALSESLEWTKSNDLWLTRLRTRMNPSQLTGPDLALQVDEPEDVDRDYSIIIARAGRQVDPAIALCTIALFGTLLVRRRSKEG